jgi:hypothetical protein
MRPLNLPIPGVTTLLGATGGRWLLGDWALTVAGGLAGALLGRAIAGWRHPGEDDPKLPRIIPSAHGSLLLSGGAWTAVIGFWAFAWRLGFVGGEGASLLLLFVVLPFNALCWLIGGPLASTAARHAIRQIQAGNRPENDRRLARMGLLLSRLMSLALLTFLLWLARMFS